MSALKIAVGVAVVALIGVVVYAYSQQGTPTPTVTGSLLPPVLEPATGSSTPRARSTGSGADVQVKGTSSGAAPGSRQN